LEENQINIALCLLTWNEIDGVKHDVPIIDRSKFEQIFCIDGGSNDGTVQYLESEGITVHQQKEKGINQACIEAVEHCTCDAFVFFHPKGTIPVEDTYKLRKFYEQGYEFVVGSRMMKNGYNEEDEKILKPRKWFVLGVGLLEKFFFKRDGNTVWDTMHGFRGMTVRAWKECGISIFDRSIDVEMVARAYKKRIKRIEFPTCDAPRIGGRTHFKRFSTELQVLKYLLWELFQRKD
jgi:glycosyltransferase involved in cell wall biosynthesis